MSRKHPCYVWFRKLIIAQSFAHDYQVGLLVENQLPGKEDYQYCNQEDQREYHDESSHGQLNRKFMRECGLPNQCNHDASQCQDGYSKELQGCRYGLQDTAYRFSCVYH